MGEEAAAQPAVTSSSLTLHAAAGDDNADQPAASDRSLVIISALEQEVAELKRLRMEDARANEKVVGMFAAQEQGWMVEKRKLKLQIQALFDQFRRIEASKEDTIAGLTRQAEEKARAAGAAEEALREERNKTEEMERKLREADEVRGLLEMEARERETEMQQGYKDAAAELKAVKNQLEEKSDRLAAELESTRRELEEAHARAEEAVSEVAALREAADHKDRVLSAMLRKAKLDAVERQALAKEARACRAKVRQTEIEVEAERWRWGKKGAVSSQVEEGCSRVDRRRGDYHNGRRAGKTGAAAVHPRTLLLEYLEAENQRDRECGGGTDDEDDHEDGSCLVATAIGGGGRWMERCSARGSDELVMADVRQLQEWVRSEADKRAATAEKRHRSELEAFTEQMRLKDERLDSLRWQLLTAELELKRVHSHSDGLDGSLSRAREENVRLEAVLADREKELKSVRDRFTLHVLGCRRRSVPPLISSQTQQDRKAAKGAWRGNGREKGAREMKGPGVISVRDLLGLELENDEIYDGEELGQVMLNPPEASCIITSKRQMKTPPNDQEQDMEEKGCQEKAAMNTTATCSAVETPTLYENRDKHRNSITEAQVVLVPGQHPQGDSDGEDTIEEEEEKEVVMDPSCGTGINNHRLALQGEEEENPTTSCEISPVSEKRNLKQQYCPAANYRWKAEDLHAMGVSYKIKRLRQQIVVLEKLASGGSKDSSGKKSLKGFSVLVSLLAKQVKRYQSLQEKTDDLCSRMTEKERDDGAKGHHGRRRSTSCNTTEELERFLEETFQLQRYVVATGQKLTEIQSRIALSSLVGGGGGAGEEMGERAGFRMGQFADIVRGLLRDVQRGFEVRIARVIGSIEGTLASEGIRLI